MAGDDDEDDKTAMSASEALPNVGKKPTHDPAVYTTGEDHDDGILFTNSASWNRFSIVLRDRGTLRFVKYVSQAANGDRWDLKGEVEVDEAGWDAEDEEADDQDHEEDELNGSDSDEELDDDQDEV